mmetsp:Transcript_9453/g.33246  ORF Transcript_9453/g.33246 Transcript_9453/m.33246 type:complete len:226 (+) Transcript_9453:1512-2189(+)
MGPRHGDAVTGMSSLACRHGVRRDLATPSRGPIQTGPFTKRPEGTQVTRAGVKGAFRSGAVSRGRESRGRESGRRCTGDAATGSRGTPSGHKGLVRTGSGQKDAVSGTTVTLWRLSRGRCGPFGRRGPRFPKSRGPPPTFPERRGHADLCKGAMGALYRGLKADPGNRAIQDRRLGNLGTGAPRNRASGLFRLDCSRKGRFRIGTPAATCSRLGATQSGWAHSQK